MNNKLNIISDIPSDFDWNELSQLFEKVGWGKREPDRLENAFKVSGNLCLAFQDMKLVGCGRSINDGEWYSIIVDVIVDPDLQGIGIGTSIMKTLISSTDDLNWVILASEVGKEQFYEKLGFQKMKLGYMLPKSEFQADRFCGPAVQKNVDGNI